MRDATTRWQVSEAGPHVFAVTAFFVTDVDNPRLAYQVRGRVAMRNRMGLGTWSDAEEAAWRAAVRDRAGADVEPFAWT